MNGKFDHAWRRKALAGDEQAAALLAEEMLSPLYRFCLYRVGGDRHRCEDVVQETLVRALADLAQYDPERSGGGVFAWLTGLARNEIRRALAQSPPVASLETLWARMDKDLLAVFSRLDDAPFDEELLRREETRQLVNAAMSQLPPHYGAALEAKYLQGRSVRDMAAAWRVSEKAVESQLSRARQAFRTVFVALAHNLNAEPEI